MLRPFQLLPLSLAFVLHSALAQNADAFVVKRATELRSGPGESSASLGPLPALAPVTRLAGRQGVWMEVKTTQGAVGWLHLFDLTTEANATKSSGASGVLRGVGSFFSSGNRQSGASVQTSTVGIRGLGAEDLTQSRPNLAAVQQLEALRNNADQARSFAADAKLAARAVEALPVPDAPAR